MMCRQVFSVCFLVGVIGFGSSEAFAADPVVTGVTITPANPNVNQALSIKVTGTNTTGKPCRVLFLKGDGQPWSLAGNPTSFPFTFGGPYPAYVYGKAGTYTFTVKGDPTAPNAKCGGEAKVTVKVGTTVVINPGSIGMMPNPCPAGWHKKDGTASGAYTCVPNKPPKQQCPPKHEWFESDCAVGCRQLIY
jgi:hypothetical protein